MISSSKEISEILECDTQLYQNNEIAQIAIDSRLVSNPEKTLFIAIEGNKVSGADFIEGLFESGLRDFVLEEKHKARFENLKANLYFVKTSVEAFQNITEHKRSQFDITTLGITGSNGKTIVKEWLSQILSKDYNICKTPKSYNSQIGVPLSVWGLGSEHNLGIFEAGISKKNEMTKLEALIQPKIGVLTNIGEAHQANFKSKAEKLEEKLRLFDNVETLVLQSSLLIEYQEAFKDLKIRNPMIKFFTWGESDDSELKIKFIEDNQSIRVDYKGKEHSIRIGDAAKHYIENCCHCIATTILLTGQIEPYISRLENLSPIEMRLEVLEGVQDMKIVNDTYNSDIESIMVALKFLFLQSSGAKKSFILSEIADAEKESSNRVLDLLKGKSFHQLILIGSSFLEFSEEFKSLDAEKVFFYDSKDEYLKSHSHSSLAGNTLLIKGARKHALDIIVQFYKKKTHSTYLNIHLNALKNNLTEFAKCLKPSTKIMIMLKAAGYGLGSLELARMLESQRVDYYAVAYIDEGIELRKEGIQKPIMVLNPEVSALDKLLEYGLEPEIYSLEILEYLITTLSKKNESQKIQIHLKIETGMHRLGIMEEQIDRVIESILKNRNIGVASIMSHLSASDDENHDDYTYEQFEKFRDVSEKIETKLGYQVLKHILNTGGIIRHPNFQMDMVRLGIGLFGFDSTGILQPKLQNVVSLVSKISQIKEVKKGASIGYSRGGILERDSRIGIISVGYADGYSRAYGNGKTSIYVNKQYAPTVGNVCMDMIMVDLTDIDYVEEGDEVELMGNHISIAELAKTANTIPYEILTTISSRVQRIYWED